MSILLLFAGSKDAEIVGAPGAATGGAAAPGVAISEALLPTAGAGSAGAAAPALELAAAAPAAAVSAAVSAPGIRVDNAEGASAGAAGAGATPPQLELAVQPPAGAALVESDPPSPSTSEFLVGAAGEATAAVTAPTPSVSLSSPAAAADADAIDQLSAWDLYSYLVAAKETLERYQVVLEAELATAEAAWNAADDDGKPAAQDVLDLAAGRYTFLTSSLREINRALDLCALTDLVAP